MDTTVSHLLPTDFAPEGFSEYLSPCPIQPFNSGVFSGLGLWLPKLAPMMKNIPTLDKENLFIKCLCNIYVGTLSPICLQKLQNIFPQVLLLFHHCRNSGLHY